MSRGWLRRIIVPAVGVGIFVLVLVVLHREVAEYKLADVADEFRALPASQVALSILLTVLNYLILTGYDALSLRFIHRVLAYRKVIFASFLSYVFSHNVGLSFFGGTAVRVRFYTAWGVPAAEIADIVVFNSVTFWLGFLGLTGIGLLFRPDLVLDDLGVSRLTANGTGLLCLLVLAAYLAWSARRHVPLRWRDWEIPLPPLRLSLAQLVLSSVDWALAAGVLYVLLPAGTPIGFGEFLSAFLLAQVAGVVSHVPAGLGVFDTVIVVFLAPEVPTAASLGALAAYRVVCYLLPLLIGAALLGAYEVRAHHQKAARIGRVASAWLPAIAAPAVTLLVFLSGAVLLVSGAIEPQHSRLDWLENVLPLSVIEASHFAGSIAGVLLLLLLARGLYQRLDVAWWAAFLLLVAGAAAMLLKGLHIEEAALSLITAAVLWPSRDQFYRRGALFEESLTPGWIAAIAAALIGAVWLFLFSYEHADYARELWWSFELYGDAPRSVRALIGAAIAVVVFGSARLLAPARPRASNPEDRDLESVGAIVAASFHLKLATPWNFEFGIFDRSG